jgi:hypothetical protein
MPVGAGGGLSVERRVVAVAADATLSHQSSALRHTRKEEKTHMSRLAIILACSEILAICVSLLLPILLLLTTGGG